MIKVCNLEKSFNNIKVLNNLSFQINDNKVFGLIGINASGKSTLLRILSGVYKYDSGSIYFDNIFFTDNKDTKKNVFYVPDDASFMPLSTPLDLELLFKSYYEKFDVEEYHNLLSKFKIEKAVKVNGLSKGMKKRLYLALAISANTKYILLDETFDGLDPLIRVEVKRLILELVDKKDVTVVVASHSLRDLEDIVDEFLILDNNNYQTSKIEDTVGKYIKFQLAYKEKVSSGMFSNLEYVSIEIIGSVVNITLKYDELINYEEILLKTNPVLIEEIELRFEDYFIYSAKEKGYLE